MHCGVSDRHVCASWTLLACCFLSVGFSAEIFEPFTSHCLFALVGLGGSIPNHHRLSRVNMSQSLLEAHLNSALSNSAPSKIRKAEPNLQRSTRQAPRKVSSGGKNYLDEARREIQSKKHRVDTILKSIGEAGVTKRFSKRKLRSLIKVHRSRS
jgi:hypothetical protein